MKRVAAIVAPLLMLACCGRTSGFLTAVIAGDTPESNDAKACYERGVACQENGEPDRAIADFTEAVRPQPDFAQAFSARGSVYRKSKSEYALAISDFTEAIRLKSDLAEASPRPEGTTSRAP